MINFVGSGSYYIECLSRTAFYLENTVLLDPVCAMHYELGLSRQVHGK